ncbi:MAG: response regulator transcription factor [Chloroflexota bacterium]
MSVRIIIADDHKIVRDGLRALLSGQDDMEVIAEAAEGREAVRLVRELSPDLVIMDITMPDLNGIEATRQISHHAPETRVLALSMHSDRRLVLEVLRAGASGYLLKDCAFDELAYAISAVLDNQKYLSPGIASIVIEDYVRQQAASPAAIGPLLTPREREVIQLLAEGKDTKEIASRLQVSTKTVETHRARLMSKLKIHSIAELTKYAIREGLSTLER